MRLKLKPRAVRLAVGRAVNEVVWAEAVYSAVYADLYWASDWEVSRTVYEAVYWDVSVTGRRTLPHPNLERFIAKIHDLRGSAQ